MKLDIDDERYWYVNDWIESKARTADDRRRVGELVSALVTGDDVEYFTVSGISYREEL